MAHTITLAMTGASGLPYGMRLLQYLANAGCNVYLIISDASREVAQVEMGWALPRNADALQEFLADELAINTDKIKVLGPRDWFSPPASGSGAPSQMVICPCSMGTLAAVSQGASDNLIERAADVVLKERGQLIVVPREMPYSTLHLQNMLKLSEFGVTIMPASPGFYQRPRSVESMVDFVVARILDHLRIPQTLLAPWGVS